MRQRGCNGDHRDFIDHVRDLGPTNRGGLESGAFDVDIPDGFAVKRGFNDLADARTHTDEDVNDASARGVESHILH